jgi:PglZ domain
MSAWIKRILDEFPADLSRLWVAADPDDVLLDEKILAVLRERGFEVLPFEDSVAFRAEYEERYREAWDRGEAGPAKALVLHLRASAPEGLPWDLLRQARPVRLSLAELFPKLSYTVVRQIDAVDLEALFDAQLRYATQSLGESFTKEFVLNHIFKISAHSLSRPEDLWRELLRMHYRGTSLPSVLANYVSDILAGIETFGHLPVGDLFTSRSKVLRVLQGAWHRHLQLLGITGIRTNERPPSYNDVSIEVPFDHPDVRSIVGSMFLDGLLSQVEVPLSDIEIPEWMKVGVAVDPAASLNLISEGIQHLLETTPDDDSSHRDWTHYARRYGEFLARFYALDIYRANRLREKIVELQQLSDKKIYAWLLKHYADLPSLPVAHGPVMLHHVPRFLSTRQSAGESKIALLVFDGLSFDQWVGIRDHLTKTSPQIGFEQSACFAWLPTTTSVSRQALFSGLRPREFAETIDSTAQEPSQWQRHWQDNGLRANEVMYRKGLKRNDQLDELEAAISDPTIKVVGLVVDTVDEIVHGAVLGKCGVASQIKHWCETGFVDRLFKMLLDKGFYVYLTADHGNVDAIGVGRPNQGVIAETRGERVRAYRSEALLIESLQAYPGAIRLDIPGLPTNFMPLCGLQLSPVHRYRKARSIVSEMVGPVFQ